MSDSRARPLRSFGRLLRATPVQTALLAFGPTLLALGQLLNGYVNGVPPAVSVGFAAVMVAFAVVATRHHAAEHRLRTLRATAGLEADDGDPLEANR